MISRGVGMTEKWIFLIIAVIIAGFVLAWARALGYP